MDFKDLMQTQEAIKQEAYHRRFVNKLEDLNKYFYTGGFTPQQANSQDLYEAHDDTARGVVTKIARAIAGLTAVPPASLFLLVSNGNKVVADDVTTVIGEQLDISNLVTELINFIRMGLAFGTAIMYPPQWVDKLVFTCAPLKDCTLGVDHSGEISFASFQKKMTAADIKAVFGHDVANSKTGVKDDTPIDVYHFIYEREDWRPDAVEKTKRRWASVYWANLKQPVKLRENGYRHFPLIVWRPYVVTEVDGHAVYGRSPAWDTLDEAKLLEEFVKMFTHGAALDAAPPVAVPKDASTFKYVPFAVFKYIDAGRVPQVMNTRVNRTYLWTAIQDTRQRILDAFDYQFFSMFNRTVETAGEAQALLSQATKFVSPLLTSFYTQAVVPLITHIINVLIENDVIGTLPEDTEIVTPQFATLLSKKLASMMQFIQIGSAVSPSFADWLKESSVIKEIHTATGAPSSIINSPEDVKKLRALKMQMQLAQQQAEIQKTAADAYSKMAQASKNGAPGAGGGAPVQGQAE